MLNLNLPIGPKEYPIVRVEMWYDRSVKSWVVQKKDSRSYQVGDCIYVYSKREALDIKKFCENELKDGNNG